MTALCPEDAKLCELAQLCGHGAPFYPEIIRQLLPGERDGKIVAPFQCCLIGKIGHQFFPGGLTGGIFDLLIQIHIFLRYDS